jgi:hypothetical protein
LLLAESHLTRRLLGAMLRRIALLPLPRGITEIAQQEEKSINKDIRNRALSEKSVRGGGRAGIEDCGKGQCELFRGLLGAPWMEN